MNIDTLVKSPNKINRIGQARRARCACGRAVWGRICRKCRRKRERAFRDHYARLKKNQKRQD